jgi:AraC family transcriptional regulator
VVAIAEFVSESGVMLHRHASYGVRPWREDVTYKLVFVTDGSYSIETASNRSLLAPGQFVVLNPGTLHRHTRLSGGKLLVELRSELVHEAARALGISTTLAARPAICELPATGFHVSAWARSSVHELRERGPEWGRLLDRLLFEIAVDLLRLEVGQEEQRHCVPAVDRALKLMQNRSQDPLTLEDLARAAGMERFSFAHAFRRSIGLSPHRHLLRLRLQRASGLLRETDDSILSVALDSGFGSLSSFNRAFRRGYVMTPTAYRARHRTGRLHD